MPVIEVAMNKIVKACFTAFDRVRIVAEDDFDGGCSAVVRSADGETVVSCARLPRDITVEIGEIDAQKEYFAAIIDGHGNRSDEVRIRKDTLYDTDEFNKRYNYDGELGVRYSREKSEFAVWSPFASAVALNIYDSGDISDNAHAEYKMTRSDNGVWRAVAAGNFHGKYYTFSVNVDGRVKEVVDPYAVSVGRNGLRGTVLDMNATNPDGWETHHIPPAAPFSSFVIYEAHLRDLTIACPALSEAYRGKYLGLTESGAGTPLDHIKKLGVSAVHFQPLYDFASVDESFKVATRDRDGEYNWGYDPLNYNAPEGSYSTNPDDGAVRVRELKQMIAALHENGIRVIMDVVYNHVYDAAASNFQALVPNYYFRTDGDAFLNGSGCGNETASERHMFRRFMIDSVSHFAREYKIDGFRFDLMALHDVDTMNGICEALKKINPAIVVYGEGWDAGLNGLPPEKRACKANAYKMPSVAFFDDIVRDGLRGSVFEIMDNGFVSGKKSAEAAVFVCAAGGTDIVPDERYKTLGMDKCAFALNPNQNVNYVAVHDNSTLWDKLNASVRADRKTLKAMNRLAATAIMTGQGASLILAGEEMLRSKPTQAQNAYGNRPEKYVASDYCFADNSYRSPDSVNQIDYVLANENADMVDFYAELIKIKTTFPQFRIGDRAELAECLHLINGADGLAVFAVRDKHSDEYAFVALNAGESARQVLLPNGVYDIYVNGEKASGDKAAPLARLNGDRFLLPPRSSAVMTAILDADTVKEFLQNRSVR
ncbi:MAG: type I pullulanase [Clostridiales bacterium]|nr:type I pullulanase [Clostridiales bacterium]